MHGFALNVNPDLSAYTKIVPCGIVGAKITSIAVELARDINIDDVTPVIKKQIYPMLERVCI